MTAERIVPPEQHQHTHIEITPDDRETASKIGELLGKQAVGAMVKSLEQEIAIAIARDPADPDLSRMQYNLELWYQSNILAHEERHSLDGYTPED
jgi:hypothetical protein